MYEFASGAAAPVAVGLIGAVDPPVTPEAVGPAPSNFEPPPVPAAVVRVAARRTCVGHGRCGDGARDGA